MSAAFVCVHVWRRWRVAERGVTLRTGILYTSRETHYSVMKAARMYRMDAVEVRASYDMSRAGLLRSSVGCCWSLARCTLSHQQCRQPRVCEGRRAGA